MKLRILDTCIDYTLHLGTGEWFDEKMHIRMKVWWLCRSPFKLKLLCPNNGNEFWPTSRQRITPWYEGLHGPGVDNQAADSLSRMMEKFQDSSEPLGFKNEMPKHITVINKSAWAVPEVRLGETRSKFLWEQS